MKKKTLCLALALVLALSLSAAAFADSTITTDGGSATTTITTSIDPTYMVTIPTSATITFEDTSMEIGSIELTAAQIDPGYVVQVTAEAGALENQADTTKTIPYTLCSGGTEFTSVQYTTEGTSTALTVDITADAWDAAYAGSYSGTITFTLAYIAA